MKKFVVNTGEQPFTIGPVAVPTNAALSPIQPEFVRLPKPGTLCPWTGLSRAKMNELILPCAVNEFHAPVKSVCLRRPGAAKGARLVSLASLLGYLRAQMEETAVETCGE
jgi:hypothetical protein